MSCFTSVIFNKSIYLKSTIEKRSIEGIKEDIEEWLTNVKTKRILEPPDLRSSSKKKSTDQTQETEKVKEVIVEEGKSLWGTNSNPNSNGNPRQSQLLLKLIIVLLLILICILFAMSIYLRELSGKIDSLQGNCLYNGNLTEGNFTKGFE